MKSARRVRGAARIARQPSKLNVVGSNPTGPAITDFILLVEKDLYVPLSPQIGHFSVLIHLIFTLLFHLVI
jgi:hypothetical protein